MADPNPKIISGILKEQTENPARQSKRTNYLLVIGINEYTHCPKLFNCTKDADELIEILTGKYQFEKKNTVTLFNEKATKSNIYKAFRKLAAQITPDDNLLIFFSGHGEYDKIFNQGYWIPVNAGRGEHDQYIPNSEIKIFLSALKCHHIFLMSDSCFSGALFAKGLDKNVARRYEKDPSRWGLTAGRNEIVSDGKPGDNSPFAESLLYQLRNADNAFGVAELCAAVTEYVQANSDQTPIGEPLKVDGHKNGQFVFHFKKDAAADWKNALATNTPAAFLTFIKMYPDDEKVGEAKSRIEKLEADTLWTKIENTADEKPHEINRKINLVKEYIRKYRRTGRFAEAVELGEFLEHQARFLKAKNSYFKLTAFAEEDTPFRKEALAILEKKDAEKTAESQSQPQPVPLKQTPKVEPPPKPNPQPVFYKGDDVVESPPKKSKKNKLLIYIAVAAGILLGIWGLFSILNGEKDTPVIKTELTETEVWNRIPKDNSDSLNWFLAQYPNTDFESEAKGFLNDLIEKETPNEEPITEIEKPKEDPETNKSKPTPPRPSLFVKFKGDYLLITIKNGKPPYILEVEKGGDRKDSESFSKAGIFTYAIGYYRNDSGRYTFILNDDLGRSDKTTVTIDPPKETIPPSAEVLTPVSSKTRPGAEMVSVAGGTFTMGSNDYANEQPPHKVTVSSFKIDKYEVTNEMYAAFLNQSGKFEISWLNLTDEPCKIEKSGDKYRVKSGFEKHPVVKVSWYGANEYVKFYGLRLPTEAEWEFAARGGNKSQNYKFAGSNKVGDVAWYSDNSARKTHPVGRKKANELGIYDMSGNVWEWCSDWYDKDYYNSSPSKNPKGASSGDYQVLRGGSWNLSVNYCRVANRDGYVPFNTYYNVGFRCVEVY